MSSGEGDVLFGEENQDFKEMGSKHWDFKEQSSSINDSYLSVSVFLSV